MLPYISLPELKLGPIPIHWFGILVATGVLIGIYLARWRAPRHGLDRDRLESFINWMLLGGFICAHVLDSLFYHPDEVAARPWSLLFLWEGLSSFGGFIGAFAGVLLWKRYRNHGEPVLAYMDEILSVFPIAWVFGRMGCSVVHDHKGRAADAPNLFTVNFPGEGPHYDLGLLEMLYAVLISLVVASLWRKPRRTGTYLALVAVLYAPMRFGLDFLRLGVGPTGDEHYLGLTPAQYACIVLLVAGVWVWFHRGPVPSPSPAPSKVAQPTPPKRRDRSRRG